MIALIAALRSIFAIAWLYVQIGGIGLMLYWLPAFLANWWVGTSSYAAPLADDIGPSRLWWLVLPALGLSLAHLHGFVRRITSAYDEVWLTFLPLAAGFILFWLWLHDAYALLGPAALFTTVHAATMGLRAGYAGAMQPAALASSASAPSGQAQTQSNSCQFVAHKARYSFADVECADALKHELLAFGKEALVTDQAAARLRQAHPGKTFRNGALLYGAPGNGKTFLAEALAGSLGVPILTVSIAQLQSMWVGQTTERIVEAFANAKAQAPCLLFFDEIDSVLAERGSADPGSETPRTVNALLTEITHARGTGVVLMAATNYPDRLDAAGKREGRFDLKLEIPAPDYPARLGLLRRGLPAGARLRPGVLEMAARHFAGFSVVRLLAIGKVLRDWSERESMQEIRFATLLAALRKVQGAAHANLREGVPALKELVLRPRAKGEIQRLAAMMRDIEGTERAGGALQRGAVFYGPPGTGKTLTAKALAKATGWTFLATTGQDLVRHEDAMDKLLAQAADLRPAIVFIDEADDILADRSYSPHTKMATNKLLTLLDGAGGAIPDVLFIAATNSPDLLDAASRRRLPLKIEFALPGPEEVEGYVRAWMDGLGIPLAPTFTLERAVRLLVGKSVADIKVALQEAVNIAVAARAADPHRGLRPGDLARAVRSLSF